MTIAGSWNQAIFRPEWITAKLGVPTPVFSLGFLPGGAFFRFNLERVALTVVAGQLGLAPLQDDQASWNACEELARRILNVLPETPIQAFGINVGFDLDASREVEVVMLVQDVVVLENVGATVELTALVRRLRLQGHVINLTLAKENNAVRLDLNHHFEVSDAGDASQKLVGSVRAARAMSAQIASVYGAIVPAP